MLLAAITALVLVVGGCTGSSRAPLIPAGADTQLNTLKNVPGSAFDVVALAAVTTG